MTEQRRDQSGTSRVNNGKGIGLAVIDNSRKITAEECKAVLKRGAAFASDSPVKSPWLLLTGKFEDQADDAELAENKVKESCIRVFGYPKLAGSEHLLRKEQVINVLLDSGGGMLDSAFKIVMYLRRYAKELNVYVPRRAKSASTLIALGAHRLHMSAFGELGPLDTQILDPRNPAQNISALDCYQSVDYVREFGFGTMSRILDRLVQQAGGQITLGQLLEQASVFALGAITPMLQGVAALDFGAWGRSLKIGERYAEILLDEKHSDASRIAADLVYGYTHHPFPIDYVEARRLGLSVEIMDDDMYNGAMAVVNESHGKSFVGFISSEEATLEAKKKKEEKQRRVAARNARVQREIVNPNGAGTSPPTDATPLTAPKKKPAKAEFGHT